LQHHCLWRFDRQSQEGVGDTARTQTFQNRKMRSAVHKGNKRDTLQTLRISVLSPARWQAAGRRGTAEQGRKKEREDQNEMSTYEKGIGLQNALEGGLVKKRCK